MIKPSKPDNEQGRLQALQSLDILDSAPEQGFDDLVAIAAAICAVPMATVSLVDSDRQWFKARVGIDDAQTSRDCAFCAHAILQPDAMTIVDDATADARFSGNPYVTAPDGIRFYAGAPLVTSEGFALGTLCVMDDKPRQLEPYQVEAMQALSRQVTRLLELRRVSRALGLQLREREWYEQQLQHYQDELEQQNADLAEQTRTDPLTGLPNRRAFAAALSMAMERSLRDGQHLSVAMLDIDHFKTINDIHGHAMGDEVLVAIGGMLRSQFAGNGLAARHGGEEFVLLLADCNADEARLQCEFVRQSIAMLPVGLPVTVSIGVAQFRRRDDTVEAMFKRADEAMYAAKRAGRDQVVVG
ncbi:sensor domain-containing diguanylate cyclase [Luteimonas aestuarii]|uniref:diguanylate cyclase n=1 Tax=Luteimonas aestuarii TaxID=453837 RepID=A0A4R5TVD0_9GAMM|nr:sensor domain-containing diguanylate cyclase [Luteimonas aestuarii]TDK25041.1 sensor domain-containing diguanylate cyclase [Luteimonas aestuarii]